MNKIDKLVDLSAWTGNWPFIHYKNGELKALKKKLKSLNVEKAFVAPIEGILEQDPMRADKNLLDCLEDDFFSPVFIIDLSYRNWQECMEAAVNDGRVRMVKLLPNYHMYAFEEEKMEKLVDLATRNNIVISIQMRVEDKRGQYPLMKVEDVHAHEVIRALAGFPQQRFIVNGILLHEIQIMMPSLDNVYMDISWLERQDILEHLYKTYTLDRFVFSSHSPFFHPEGNVYKLKYSRVPMDEIEKVMYRNAEKIFGTAK